MNSLAHLASRPDMSRGRQHSQSSQSRGLTRDAFQRDRDRIIHSIAFRRLRGKTQVFVAPDGDHFRVRLTHSLEVAQIGRTMARALGLNEDLTEALCLAHDLGHPPFGHAGEDALAACLAPYGGFDHNAHTLRILMQLEAPYPGFDGLNLSWETLEGLAKHNGPVVTPGWAMQACDTGFPLALDQHASLEAQVAAVADDIAYDNHDIDDGLRAGLLNIDDLLLQPLVAQQWAEVRATWPNAPMDRCLRELVRNQIGAMVDDVIHATQSRVADSGVATSADVRTVGAMLVGFSPTMAIEEAALKRFLYARMYHHPSQLAAAIGARRIVTDLFEAYQTDPAAMGGDWRARLPADPVWHARHIGDYIAGMTDRFAMDRFAALFGRDALPKALDRG
jgi:dGTPase